MADDFKEEVVASGGKGGDDVVRGFGGARGPIEEEMSEGDSRPRDGVRMEDSRADGGTIDRVLPQAVIDRLDKMEADAKAARAAQSVFADDTAAEDLTEVDPADPAAVEAAPAGDPAAVQTPAPKAETPVVPDERYTRLESANQKLLAELEAERGKPREAPAPHKLLSEASDNYIDDAVGAVRRLVAVSMGIDDLTDKRIDDEMRDFYVDLTAHVIGVTPEPHHLAKRETARARALLAREKRERTAEKQTSAEKAQHDAEAEKAANAAVFIGNRLQTKQSDGRSLVDDYPLLAFAEDLDGMKPEAVLWKVLQHETKTGRIAFDPHDDDKNIRAAAKILNDRYQVLRDKFAKASTPSISTNPSTAQPNGKPPTAAIAETRKDTRPGPTARTLTTADRSVAPATPPAKKSAPKSEEKPKFKTNEERQNWALRHLND